MSNSELHYMIASRLDLDVRAPLERLVDLMEVTARRYIDKGENGELAHCDGMELAGFMECFAGQANSIRECVDVMVRKHDQETLKKDGDIDG